MGFFSDIFSDSPEEKIDRWRNELVEALPRILKEEDGFEVDDDGSVNVKIGSVYVFVEFAIVEEENEGLVVIYSPLVIMPKENLLPFYRKLLDLNNNYFQFGSLSMRDNIAVLTRTIPVEGLEESAFLHNVGQICDEADFLDDELINEFGVKRFDFDEI